MQYAPINYNATKLSSERKLLNNNIHFGEYVMLLYEFAFFLKKKAYMARYIASHGIRID